MPHRISSAEYTRLAALYRYGILDTAGEPAFDVLLQDLSLRLRVPMAQILFADTQRVWAKSTVGAVPAEWLRGGTVADVAIADQPTLVIADTEAPDRLPGDPPPCHPPARSLAAMRIVTPEDDAIGLLLVADAGPRTFGLAETAAIEAAVHNLSVLLESRRRARQDQDTGALDHEAFADSVGRMVAASRAGRQRISLVRLDIAAFRAGLEAVGSGLGRIVLRRMADIGLHQVRRRDCFGRVGNDAFAVLLTDTGEAGAAILAERLSRHLLQGWSGPVPDLASIGIVTATVKPVIGDDAESILMRTAFGSAQAVPLRSAGPSARVA